MSSKARKRVNKACRDQKGKGRVGIGNRWITIETINAELDRRHAERMKREMGICTLTVKP